MTRLQKEIIKKAGCDVLSCEYTTIEGIKKDVMNRFKRQQKALKKAQDKGDILVVKIIENSIQKFEKTIAVLQEY